MTRPVRVKTHSQTIVKANTTIVKHCTVYPYCLASVPDPVVYYDSNDLVYFDNTVIPQ